MLHTSKTSGSISTDKDVHCLSIEVFDSILSGSNGLGKDDPACTGEDWVPCCSTGHLHTGGSRIPSIGSVPFQRCYNITWGVNNLKFISCSFLEVQLLSSGTDGTTSGTGINFLLIRKLQSNRGAFLSLPYVSSAAQKNYTT